MCRAANSAAMRPSSTNELPTHGITIESTVDSTLPCHLAQRCHQRYFNPKKTTLPQTMPYPSLDESTNSKHEIISPKPGNEPSVTHGNFEMFRRIQYLLRCYKLRHSRYQNLLKAVRESQCSQIIEVGVYNGRTAVKMIETASISHPPDLIRYHGFDLFEQLTDQDLESELSKRPPTKETVSQHHW